MNELTLYNKALKDIKQDNHWRFKQFCLNLTYNVSNEELKARFVLTCLLK